MATLLTFCGGCSFRACPALYIYDFVPVSESEDPGPHESLREAEFGVVLSAFGEPPATDPSGANADLRRQVPLVGEFAIERVSRVEGSSCDTTEALGYFAEGEMQFVAEDGSMAFTLPVNVSWEDEFSRAAVAYDPGLYPVEEFASEIPVVGPDGWRFAGVRVRLACDDDLKLDAWFVPADCDSTTTCPSNSYEPVGTMPAFEGVFGDSSYCA